MTGQVQQLVIARKEEFRFCLFSTDEMQSIERFETEFYECVATLA